MTSGFSQFVREKIGSDVSYTDVTNDDDDELDDRK